MMPEPQALPEQFDAAELAIARFRERARVRAGWLDTLLRTPGGAGIEWILDDRDSPEAELEWRLQQSWSAASHAHLKAVEAALAADTRSPLSQVARVFGLDAPDRDLLEACAAVALDPELARLCAYLQDDPRRTYVTEELAARLYGHGRCGIWSPDSALFRWELVAARETGPAEPAALSLDPQIRDWMAGRKTLPEALVGRAWLHAPREPLSSWPLAETVGAIRSHLRAAGGGPVRVVVEGGRGSGRKTFAAAASAALSLPLLMIDSESMEDRELRRLWTMAQRYAFLEGCALGWTAEAIARRPWASNLPVFPVQFVIAEARFDAPAPAGVAEYRVSMPRLTVAERSSLWRRHAPESQAWPEEELRTLAERYRVQPGDIAAAAEGGVASAADAGLRVREAARGRLGNLAQYLRCSFTWDDLVAPPELRESLEDIVFEANHRAAFWERPEASRLFPQGQGLMALFSGPPGTGKTMAAQVMAATLGYDLFRVDLAGVVSKWVGETSQNFERILSRAADMHALLLFDECDAIFSKRTSEVRDAQDKFANTDAAYLLQAVENYPGIALLATNQKGNIDPAFIRRLRFVLEFAKPDAAQRLEIWRKVTDGLAGAAFAEKHDAQLRALAEAIESTGAQIKFAVLGGLFAAKRDGATLDLRRLLRGMERELAKEGRGLGTRERERILSHG